MTFLNPVILFGLIAAGIPILLHFLNLRKVKRVEFSSLKFLKELQQTKIRRLKFKRILLLILRVLIIVFIVLAFARPTIKSSIPVADSSTEKTVFFLLDNSFSMSYVESNGSFLNQAKSFIKEITDNDEGSNRFYIITSTGDSLFFTAQDINRNKKIESIEIKSVKGNLNNALDQILNISEQEQTFIHEMFVFSDLQISNLDTSKMILGNSENNKIRKVTFVDFSLGNNNNRSVSSPDLQNQIIRPGSEISVKTIVTNHSSNEVLNQTASLFINGNRRSIKSFDLGSGQSKEIVFNTTLSDSGFIFMKVELEEDDISNDNYAYLSFYVPSRINVNIYSDNKNDYTFLKTALERSGAVNINTYAFSRFSGAVANNGDVDILFINTRAANLSESLSGRNRLIVFPGSNVTEAAYNTSVQPLGIYTSSLQQRGLLNFYDILFEHPLLKDLFEENKNRLNTPSVRKVLRRPKSGSETPVITLSDGTPALSEVKFKEGSLLLYSLSLTMDWSDLPLKSIFAPLMLKSVFYLSTDFDYEQKYTGSEIPVTLNGNRNLLEVIDPDNREEFINEERIGTGNVFTYRNTSEAGFYKFYSRDKLFSVYSLNVDPTESYENCYDFNNIKNIFESGDIPVSVILRSDNISEKLNQYDSGYEIWKHFLLAAIICALIEMFVARTTKKELITGGEV